MKGGYVAITGASASENSLSTAGRSLFVENNHGGIVALRDG